METRANYALIGLFTLGVVLGAFLFVFWFTGTGAKTERKLYHVQFTGSVSGLANGASVLFNGLKVGEVTELGLMREDPSRVYANILIDARTPVKVDTKAQLEYGSLTGVATVALQGGGVESAPLPADGVLTAAPSNFQDLMLMAQRLGAKADNFLERMNKLIDDNSGNLTDTVVNIKTLSGTLADSSSSFRDAMQSVDPAKVKSILANADQSMAKINGLLGAGEGKAMITDISEAARSLKKLAESLTKFANNGLRQYEGLAVDGRKTLQDVDATVKQLKKDPQSILFGPKATLPEYGGH